MSSGWLNSHFGHIISASPAQNGQKVQDAGTPWLPVQKLVWRAVHLPAIREGSLTGMLPACETLLQAEAPRKSGEASHHAFVNEGYQQVGLLSRISGSSMCTGGQSERRQERVEAYVGLLPNGRALSNAAELRARARISYHFGISVVSVVR